MRGIGRIRRSWCGEGESGNTPQSVCSGRSRCHAITASWFDLNGDAREEVTFKFRFGEPRHGDGSEHTHIQPFVVRKATGDDALRGNAGESSG